MSMAFLESVDGGVDTGQSVTTPVTNPAVVQNPNQVKPVDTLTPAQALAAQNASRLGEVADAADRAGSVVSGADQEEVDAILAGVQSGIYSAADALGRLSNIEAAGRTNLGTGDGSDDDTTTSTTDPFLPQKRSDAFSRMRALLSRFGLSELEGALNSIITSGMVDLQDPNAIVFALRDQPAYKRRFAGNAARAAAGLAELDPSTYIGLEEQYRQMLQASGLDRGFYDDLTDFQGFIEGDVSPAELQERINQGYRAVADADPAVKAQMKELYDVTDSDLAMFFLDPKRAQPLLTTRERTRKAQAAGIAARGKEQGGIQLTKDEAEALAARGITGEEAFQRFGEMGTLAGLYQGLYGEEDINREQQLGATFRYNTSALDAVRRRQRQRLAEFEAGGQFARTSGATSGTVETGAGLAQ